jgi:hypothetical protein
VLVYVHAIESCSSHDAKQRIHVEPAQDARVKAIDGPIEEGALLCEHFNLGGDADTVGAVTDKWRERSTASLRSPSDGFSLSPGDPVYCTWRICLPTETANQ